MKKTIFALFIFTGTWLFAQSPQNIWQRSMDCFDQNNYHGAVEALDSLLAISPGLPNALYNKGIALISLGDFENACYNLNLARKLEDKNNKQFVSYICDPEFTRKIMLDQFYKKEKVFPELGYRPRYTRSDSLRGALRPERTCFDVYFYDLSVKINAVRKRIEGSNSIYFHVVQPTRRIQIDLFASYDISYIMYKGSPLSYHREFNAIFIDFPEELAAGTNQIITIAYGGKPNPAPNPPWDGGFVWKHDEKNNLWIGVACEHLGASSWWPNKDHFSDKPDSVKITLDVPKGYQAVSNGNLRNSEPGKRYDRFVWFVDYPINNYNVTFYVGKYVAFNDTLIENHDTLRMDYNVLAYNVDTARQHFKQAREVLSFYNKAFGYFPFPEDGYGLVESPYEGMEHQTAIAYGNGFDNTEEYRNRLYDYIIVHESAHEWWGNAVTAADMADIWIHEGFATYAEYLFLEQRFSKDEYLYELTDKSHYIFNIWPMVQNRDVNENSFASNDVYNKGAMMLHCLRCTINNDSLFFGIIRDFNLAYRYKTVTTSDFINFVNNKTGSDYTAFFKKYLYETEIPVLEYSFVKDQDDLILKYRWSGVGEGFVMPFGIETNDKKSFRLSGKTSWQEFRIPQTSWFNFFNIWSGYTGCPDNAFTYYHTCWIQQ